MTAAKRQNESLPSTTPRYALAAEALERRVQTVFLVGCGGLLSAMYGAQYFIESRLGSLATSLLTQ